jgi:hypothetical protein
LRKQSIILIAFWFAFHCFADIRELKSMNEIIDYVDEYTLIVWDNDNTLTKPLGYLGSDQWFYFLVERFQKMELLSKEEAVDKAAKIWNKTQNIIDTKLVEPGTAELISQIGKKGATLMALTARDIETKHITRKQLLAHNIDFSKYAPFASDISFSHLGAAATYSQGILFQGEGNDKGEVLIEFLKIINKSFKRILFIDDRDYNVKNMFKALSRLPIEHIEFRYAGADEDVKAFHSDFQNIGLLVYGELPAEI